jgi:F-type H+-transporting ATPase subunit epsilon
MPETIELEVVTPERSLVHEAASEIQIPGKDGYMGVMPGHAPLLSLLGSGFLSYAVQGKTWYLAVHGGFVEVLPDHVRVLANIAERAEEIDLGQARTELQTANEQLLPGSGVDPAVALEAANLAMARVSAAEKK